MPLVRYNIKDTGSVFSFGEVEGLLKKSKIYPKVTSLINKQLKYPFLVLRGRSDVAILFYAINIFPKYILDGLKSNPTKNLVTGAYVAFVADGPKHQELLIRVELASGVKTTQKSQQTILESLDKSLQNNSSEYRKLRATYGNKVRPRVSLFKLQDQGMFRVGHRSIIQTVGKKPRMFLGN